MYHLHLTHWLSIFKREQFIFLNGEDLILKPAKVMCKFETEAKLTPFFCDSIGGDFVQSDEGFYCFEPKNNDDNTLTKCAHTQVSNHKKSVKGATRDGHTGKSVLPKAAADILKKFYAPYNEQFEKEFGMSFEWNKTKV